MSEPEAGSNDESRADSKPEGRGRSDWLRSIPTLIAAVTALITAIAALRKPPDTTATKATYEELSKLVEKLEDSTDQNHQDIVALRNFLDGYLRAEGRLLAKNDGAAVGTGREPAGGRVRVKPPKVSGERAGEGKTEDERPSAMPAAPPPDPAARDLRPAPAAPAALPTIAPRKDMRRPREFRDLIRQTQTEGGAGKDGPDKDGKGGRDDKDGADKGAGKDGADRRAAPPPAPSR